MQYYNHANNMKAVIKGNSRIQISNSELARRSLISGVAVTGNSMVPTLDKRR